MIRVRSSFASQPQRRLFCTQAFSSAASAGPTRTAPIRKPATITVILCMALSSRLNAGWCPSRQIYRKLRWKPRGNSDMDRREKGEAVIRMLNQAQDQPTLEALREEFPFLAESTASYALGDVWSRPGLDYRTRQLAAAAAFSALALQPFGGIHGRSP